MIYGAAHTNGLYTYPNGSGTQFLDGCEQIKTSVSLPLLKIYCTPDYNLNYPLETTFNPAEPGNCTALCQTVEFSTALGDAAFPVIVMSTFTFANNPSGVTNWWRVGPTKAQLDAEYAELYDLTVHLLTTYNNSGKRFILGNWEGDWSLMDSVDPTTFNDRKMIDFYAEFLAKRQKAVRDARATTPHTNVSVEHAIEVNRVLDAKLYPHRQRVVNQIAKKFTPDLVSYSAYDSTIADIGYGANQAAWEAAIDVSFPKAINIIKRAWPGVPWYVGEFGFGENEIENEQPNHDVEAMVTKVAQLAEANGCQFLIYWQVFDNEPSIPYTYRGYWLVKPDGTVSTAGDTMKTLSQG